MDFSYENGVFIAFLYFLYSVGSLIIRLNSQFEKNLNKVGLRTSWTTFQPKQLDQEYLDRPFYQKLFKLIFWFVIQLVSVLLSWLSVFLGIGLVVYRWSKDHGTPNEVKTLRWKLRNIDLLFENIVKEMEIAAGNDPANLEAAIESVKSDMRSRGLVA